MVITRQLNRQWHEQHQMGARADIDERVRWHLNMPKSADVAQYHSGARRDRAARLLRNEVRRVSSMTRLDCERSRTALKNSVVSPDELTFAACREQLILNRQGTKTILPCE